MIKFIRAQGDERVDEIKRQEVSEHTRNLEKTIEAKKKMMTEQHTAALTRAETALKIEKSAEANMKRITKMRRINELVESLSWEAKIALEERMRTDRKQYAQLLQKLLVQGMIKMWEPSVTLRCRESDQDVLASVIDSAVAEYKQAMLSQVAACKGKDDIPAKVKIDTKNFLPEWNATDPEHSCLGGFKMYAKKNKIVCSQTLDDRIELVYQQAIPKFRLQLFPSLAKEDKKAGK